MKMMTIRPPDNLKMAIKTEAKRRGLTVNALVVSILWEFVNKLKK